MRRALAGALLAACAPALAADAPPGRAKAQACAVCHGVNGVSSAPDAPHLAGQPRLYVAEQLRAYRSGKRRHEVMGVIARALSDADIEDLAQWYASIAIEAKVPP